MIDKTRLLQYIDIVKSIKSQSVDPKLQVGSIIVDSHKIISTGYNRLLEFDYISHQNSLNETVDEVVHSETDAILKITGIDANYPLTMICTSTPCIRCATNIILSGITEFYYMNEYKNTDGIQRLMKYNIECFKLTEDLNNYGPKITITRLVE